MSRFKFKNITKVYSALNLNTTKYAIIFRYCIGLKGLTKFPHPIKGVSKNITFL